MSLQFPANPDPVIESYIPVAKGRSDVAVVVVKYRLYHSRCFLIKNREGQ